MGLFNFLKKKEQEPTPAITASIHAQTVEVKQQTRGELPLAEIGGYVSPSGGFCELWALLRHWCELYHGAKKHEAVRDTDRSGCQSCGRA